MSSSQLVNSSIVSALTVNISRSSLLVLRIAFVRSVLIFALFCFTHARRLSSLIIHSPLLAYQVSRNCGASVRMPEESSRIIALSRPIYVTKVQFSFGHR